MNKMELCQAIAARTDITLKLSGQVLDAICETIQERVAAGEKVIVMGFGAFEPRQRQARDGRNPQTGESIKIPATTVPVFHAGKEFKDQVAKR